MPYHLDDGGANWVCSYIKKDTFIFDKFCEESGEEAFIYDTIKV